MDNVDDSGDFTEAQQALMEKMLTQGLSAMWTLGKFLVEQVCGCALACVHAWATLRAGSWARLLYQCF